jgi:hypothetical protein
MHRRLPPAPRVRCSQEAGGNNCPWSADAPLRRRHSTNSSARTTVETAAMHSPASSNKLKPLKFKTQITLAIEPMHMVTISTEVMICLMITPQSRLPQIGRANPKLGASLLQCTLRSARARTPFNKFLNKSYSYCGCNEASGNQQPFGFAAVQYRNNDPHHAYPDGDQQRTIYARNDLSHQSPPGSDFLR